jgi:transposase-like protein
MNRIPPTERIRKSLDDMLDKGTTDDAASQFLKLAVQLVAQRTLESERTDFLGREPYERKDASRGKRNGYEPGRIRTAEGEIPLAAPQVRESAVPFRSKLMSFLAGNSDVLKRLAVEMYARGLSTRDIDDAFIEATGKRLLSKSAVSEVTEALWEQYEAFKKRDLSGLELECLFLDAVYESLRLQAGAKEGVLCAWGILRDGRKVLLHMTLGNKESAAAWLDLLRDLIRRGLRIPVSVTSDGAPGAIAAIEQAFSKSLRIRCWVHKMRNLMDKVPAEAAAEFKAHVIGIRDAATYELGEARAREVIARYGRVFPSAIDCLKEDLEASLNHLKLPIGLRRSARSTNLMERSFVEERRRTKVIPRFFDEKSCLKLVFAALSRAGARWRRVRLSKSDLVQLDLLRQRLRLATRSERHSRLHSNRQLVHA